MESSNYLDWLTVHENMLNIGKCSKNSQKIIFEVLTAIKFKSFQWKSITMLNYAPILNEIVFSCIWNQ